MKNIFKIEKSKIKHRKIQLLTRFQNWIIETNYSFLKFGKYKLKKYIFDFFSFQFWILITIFIKSSKMKKSKLENQFQSSKIQKFNHWPNLNQASNLIRPLKGLLRPVKGLIRPLKGLIRPFKCLIRPLKGLIRPFKGLMRPFKGGP